MKIILMMAMTADGKIAKNSDHFPDWTSKEDKKMFMRVTKEVGVVIMGDKTFFTFPKALPERLLVKRIEEIVLNHHRCRAIQDLLSSKLDKYFPDLKRGMQMVQEQEYKISRMGLGPGPLRNPFVVSGRKASKGNA